MATYMPSPQIPPKPHPDLSSNTPPDSAVFHMNNFPQRAPSVQMPQSVRNQHRVSGEYRGNGTATFANGNTPLPVPTAPHAHMANGGPRNMHGMGGPGVFEGPRSPPNTKNTSHVPCKFFKVGQCQAGKACPFSHSTDTSKYETPCKYFAKGNCKFGAKCALAHVLPNGRIVNKPNGSLGGHLNLGGRVDPHAYQESILGNSLLAQQANGNPAPFVHQYSHIPDHDPGLLNNQQKTYEYPPQNDTVYTSHPDSKYGSPRDDVRLPMSPVMHLSTLDAPLPASFDSQGISYMARHGPVAASVPSKFGLESPPSSLPKKSALPSDALRNLHDSAFGRDNRTRIPQLGSSPSGPIEEYTSQRMMHSQRVAKPKMLSASLPRPFPTDDWDDGILFGGEEDYLPNTLSHLLSPEEKMRRFSSKEQDPSAIRDNLSGQGTPAEVSSKVGSPSTASPSRFSSLFSRQKRDEESNGLSTSNFGHVGSPLRNSSLHLGTSPGVRAVSRPISGDVSPHLASPPRQSPMSMISQQLQRTRLSRAESSEAPSSLHPASAWHTSNPSSRLDRAVSSSSINTSRIDEEQPDCVFSMEEEEYNGKRYSGQWNQSRSPDLGPIGDGRQLNAQIGVGKI